MPRKIIDLSVPLENGVPADLGPGPAIEYTNHTSHTNHPEHADDEGTEHDKGKGKWKEIDYSYQGHHHQHHTHHQHHHDQCQDTPPRPLCGLPIGAGPESTCHMPSWLGCPLRRSVSVGALMITGGEEGEEDVRGEEQEEEQEMVQVPEGELALEMVREPEDQGLEESQEESREGEKDGEGDDKQLTPPSPPPRRHSTAT